MMARPEAGRPRPGLSAAVALLLVAEISLVDLLARISTDAGIRLEARLTMLSLCDGIASRCDPPCSGQHLVEHAPER